LVGVVAGRVGDGGVEVEQFVGAVGGVVVAEVVVERDANGFVSQVQNVSSLAWSVYGSFGGNVLGRDGLNGG
jgi:hypothetical protein